MLGSITPLGERGRGSRWWLTATAYTIGSVAGGAALGGVFGLAGWALPVRLGPVAVLIVVALLGLAGAAVDAGIGGLRIPTIRRQVDEDWLHRYRGWVYGIGFGFQLGLGVLTIVTTAAVYAVFALALLAGSWVVGVV